jgi:ADP-ribosylglycohydrolase
MPVHWYYNRAALARDYGYVKSYHKPKAVHPDSILWRSEYRALNEKGEILHDQARYWGQQGVHYHQWLAAGENTVNLKLCSLLIEGLNRCGEYDAGTYLRAYIDFMTTPGNHQDTYLEEYHRRFFENYASGKPPDACGVPEKHISGLIGMIPIIVHYAHDPQSARKNALTHLGLTHLGARMEAAGAFLLDTLIPVLAGERLQDVLVDQIRRQDNPLLRHPITRWIDEPDEKVIGSYLSSACYVEDAVPAIAFLALKYHDDIEAGLVANTNLGGDNAGRGAALGSLLGAANGLEAIPERWVQGLLHPPPELRRAESHAG